jgi:hypothetical protein
MSRIERVLYWQNSFLDVAIMIEGYDEDKSICEMLRCLESGSVLELVKVGQRCKSTIIYTQELSILKVLHSRVFKCNDLQHSVLIP